jgi:peptidoglycan/xylan/chitin deacetylase (PgdA/CDA1 family)
MNPRRLVLLVVTVALAVFWPVAPRVVAQSQRTMALTFDDLPFVRVASEDDEDPLENATRGTAALLEILAAHRAPAVGFVNEGKLEGPKQDAYIDLLRQWIDAGALLGNHGFAHVDLNTTSAADFQADITRGEITTRRLMQPRTPYTLYFRHPFTHTGNTAEKQTTIEQFLAARNYRIAPHTIDTADYIFNVSFVRAWGVDDPILKYRSLTAYLEFVKAATDFAERAARQIFTRDIPQVMLLHANDINVETLDELLNRLEARGYRFVTLDEAMSDPAYATKNTYVTESGPTWLVRWSRSLGQAVSFTDDPDPPQWVMDIYNRK